MDWNSNLISFTVGIWDDVEEGLFGIRILPNMVLFLILNKVLELVKKVV